MLCTNDQISFPFYLQVEAIQVQSLLGMLDPEYKVSAFLLSVRNCASNTTQYPRSLETLANTVVKTSNFVLILLLNNNYVYGKINF